VFARDRFEYGVNILLRTFRKAPAGIILNLNRHEERRLYQIKFSGSSTINEIIWSLQVERGAKSYSSSQKEE
jgi:hypothetical protein